MDSSLMIVPSALGGGSTLGQIDASVRLTSRRKRVFRPVIQPDDFSVSLQLTLPG